MAVAVAQSPSSRPIKVFIDRANPDLTHFAQNKVPFKVTRLNLCADVELFAAAEETGTASFDN